MWKRALGCIPPVCFMAGANSLDIHITLFAPSGISLDFATVRTNRKNPCGTSGKVVNLSYFKSTI